MPLSHFCEKARWAVERLGIDFHEDAHLPMFHYPAALLGGGGRTVPVLVTRAGVFSDSTDILRYLDRFASPAGRLYPPEHQAEIAALEDDFDANLGRDSRRWAYQQLLPMRDELIGAHDGRVPAWEQQAMRLLYPLFTRLLRQGLGISSERAQRSLERVRQVFAEVSRRLADGRRFLVGDRFTAADLTFAALAYPAVLPPGGPLGPSPPSIPEGVVRVVDELRATAAGQLVTRLYAEERRRIVA
jgi:glutathione S-transferase